MTHWATSDQHFEHKNNLAYSNRPFSSIQEHDETLIRNWNECVQDGDIVFVLGDVSLSKHPALRVGPLLKGKKYLISGNHDATHPRYGNKAQRVKAEYAAAGWVVCNINAKLVIGGHVFHMNHLPPTNEDPRFAQYLPPPNLPGVTYLCGHVHTAWKTNGNIINVGVDQWDYRPVSFEQIIELIQKSTP